MKSKYLTGLLAVAFLAFPAGIGMGQTEKANENHAGAEKAEKAKKDGAKSPGTQDNDHSEAGDSAKQGESSSKARPVNFWMDQKMRLSSKALESLAMGDFDQMAASAEFMLGLNKIESFWRRGEQAKEYRAQLDQFALANRRLIRAARKENIEAATLAFNQLTVSCVSCHQHLRDGK